MIDQSAQPQFFNQFASINGDTLIVGTDTLAPDERWQIEGFHFGVHGNASIAAGSSVQVVFVDKTGFEFGRTIFHLPAVSKDQLGSVFTPWVQMKMIGPQMAAPLYARLITGTGGNLATGYCIVGVSVRKVRGT